MKLQSKIAGLFSRTTLDLSRWAVLAHKDDSGFGRQAADIRAVLGLGYHLAVPSERLSDKPLKPPHELPLAPSAGDAYLRSILKMLDGIIFFERSNWHPRLLQIAREMGVKTVCIPNWEWFRPDHNYWRYCDFFICPTRYTLSVLRSAGFDRSTYLPWTLNLSAFPGRTIKGPAKLFIHNAGLVDADDRKATIDTILAFKRTTQKDIRLIVRLQRAAQLPEPDERIEIRIGNLEHPSQLYAQGDVAIQPSKMEGIGFMVLEPVCNGMPVITLDYPPMNEFVQHRELLVTPRWFKRRAYPTTWVRHAHLRLPRHGDLANKIEWSARNDLSVVSQQNRAWAEATFNYNTLRNKWSDILEAVFNNKTEMIGHNRI
jgi:glycosyltransferase involved in cell wall biosynthesis